MTNNMNTSNETMPINGLGNTEAVDTQSSMMELTLKPETLLGETLPMMGKGMLGIFIVIGVIILVVYLLNNVFKPKDDQSAN